MSSERTAHRETGKGWDVVARAKYDAVGAEAAEFICADATDLAPELASTWQTIDP